MTKAQQEIEKLKYRITECNENIRSHKQEIRLLEGEILGIRHAIDRLEPLLPKEPS